MNVDHAACWQLIVPLPVANILWGFVLFAMQLTSMV